jgi:uncharacterized protein YegL
MATIINNDNNNDNNNHNNDLNGTMNNSSQPIQDASTPSASGSDPAAAAVETGDVAVTAAVKDMTVTFVQDVSGSMEDQRRSVVNGINEIVGDLKKRYAAPCEHNATVCVIRFSSHDNIRIGPTMPVQDMPAMTVADLKCDGSTALWDAVAIAIARMNTDSTGVPATTYIFTDGDNNDSMKHTQSGVNEMIADNKKKNPMHSVLFIGSDPSTRRNADDMGLDRVHSIQHDSENTPVAYEVCRRALGRCVSGDTQSTEFNESDIALSETPSLRRTDQQPDQAHSWENVKSDAVGDSQPDSPPESDQFESDYAPSRTQSSGL